MPSRMLMAAVPLLAALAAPSIALGATEVRVDVNAQGQKIVTIINDDAGETIDAQLFAAGVEVVAQNGALPGANCNQGTDDTRVECPGTFDAIVAFGNGGNDDIEFRMVASGVPPLPGGMRGGAGNDTLKAPPLNGDAQPQTLLQGDEGDDVISGGFGDDEVHGDAGNDSVSGGTTGADIVDGGPGFDSIPDGGGDYSRAFGDHTLSISLDGLANDGEAGEGDNVFAVEKLSARADVVTLIGDNGPNDLFVEAGAATLRGLGGDDRLVTHDGNDVIEGGDGNDFLEAGFGNDVLDGGAGVDQFSGDRTESNVFAVGNDEIRARDGNAEQIGCGIGGGDRAIVDFGDVVASDCESVDRSKGPEENLKPGKPKLLGKLSIKSIAQEGPPVPDHLPGGVRRRRGQLRVDKKTAKKLKLGKSRTLAKGKKSIKAAGKAKVTLKVVKKARKRFKKLKKAKVTLVTRTTMAGKTTPAKRKLTLKR